ncbi:aminotransferase class IV [Microaerobacter geothermalis]|uniref:aminotransferase class IV n=1 Tax=Microaerobacter geothermalis TaxID=674972 RepID=UPI001F20C46D|nr:aminotransferase class IV [Microaerobacter geothermalis]MCF6094676.1 aminotransferase class IV [Microaerobacter geothermalis]
MKILLNGKLYNRDEAVCSVMDHGLLYGISVFETLRLYDGFPFLYKDHYLRLSSALVELGVKCPFTDEDFIEMIQFTAYSNELNQAYIRVTVTAGIEELGIPYGEYHSPQVIVMATPLKQTRSNKKGLIPLNVPRNTPEGYQRYKASFINNRIGKRELGNQPHMEGLFLTREGYIAEGIVSNIFFVKSGILHTPSLETGILPGVTRKFVMALARKLGIPFQEGLYKLEELETSEEVFITNSVQEIVPISFIQNRIWDKHPLSSFLHGEYKKYVYDLNSYRNI